MVAKGGLGPRGQCVFFRGRPMGRLGCLSASAAAHLVTKTKTTTSGSNELHQVVPGESNELHQKVPSGSDDLPETVASGSDELDQACPEGPMNCTK